VRHAILSELLVEERIVAEQLAQRLRLLSSQCRGVLGKTLPLRGHVGGAASSGLLRGS
jgi:hypothetical protein